MSCPCIAAREGPRHSLQVTSSVAGLRLFPTGGPLHRQLGCREAPKALYAASVALYACGELYIRDPLRHCNCADSSSFRTFGLSRRLMDTRVGCRYRPGSAAGAARRTCPASGRARSSSECARGRALPATAGRGGGGTPCLLVSCISVSHCENRCQTLAASHQPHLGQCNVRNCILRSLSTGVFAPMPHCSGELYCPAHLLLMSFYYAFLGVML